MLETRQRVHPLQENQQKRKKRVCALLAVVLTLSVLTLTTLLHESVSINHLRKQGAWLTNSFHKAIRQVPAAQQESTKGAPNATDKEPTAPPTKECVRLRANHLDVRFTPKNLCVSRREVQQILLDLVNVAAQSFEQHNLTYWLDSGTLLGSFREHSIIPHDVDADFGTDAASLRRLQTSLKLELPTHYTVNVFQSAMNPVGNRDEELPIRIIDTRYGLYVDVFAFLESVDDTGVPMVGPIPSVCFRTCVHCPKTKRKKKRLGHFLIPKAWVFPLQTCLFANQTYQCPHEPVKYLDWMYGDDFMTPH